MLVLLPDVVMADSVKVDFTARLVNYVALFALDLGSAERPGLWQSVEPRQQRSHIVLMPGPPCRRFADCPCHLYAERRWDQRSGGGRIFVV